MTAQPVSSSGSLALSKALLSLFGGKVPAESDLAPDWAGHLPQARDPLIPILPLDVNVLERGMEQFLRQFERLAATLGGSHGQFAFPLWLVAAVAAGAIVSWEIVRRERKRRRLGNPFSPDPADESSPWTTDWFDPTLEDRQ